MENISEGFLWYLAFLFSTVFHEAAHAFVAMKLGDDTAMHGGQVTLDPVPHIRREPVGTVVVPLLSFIMSMGGWMVGWASTPYDPYWARQYPKRSALMALAGPVSNLTLLLVCGILVRLGMVFDIFAAPDMISYSHVTEAANAGWAEVAATLLSIFFSMNLILFAFNLLPIPPLDGSGIIPLFLEDDTAMKYMDFIATPAFSMIGLLMAWNLFDHIFSPVHLLFINLLYPEFGYP